MSVPRPEFDQYADAYKTLSTDPIRERFAPGSDFFHKRKWFLLAEFMERTGMRAEKSAWLDVGCGQGDLLRLGMDKFGEVAGCDLSTGMLEACEGLKVTPQTDPTRLPFPDKSFDLITAVCVYHHVEAKDRPALSAEIGRVLRPGGTACIIEHNPFNPLTQFLVSRIPVDADAHLLTPRTAHRLLNKAGLTKSETLYFLYFPESMYQKAQKIESLLRRVPAGGQYAAFAQKQ
ncbi:MAG TPA: class I SAM-dependent methyltransferase [Bryobacteraceae bacterium]|nr:class I SAM-dependent methyltransferase [Bryobacteraceae bacterium]